MLKEKMCSMELVNDDNMMMMIRPMTIMTTTTKQVHSSSNAQDLYLAGAQFESWPPNQLEVFHGFSQSHLVSEQYLEMRL
jgi:hypothetical protein